MNNVIKPTTSKWADKLAKFVIGTLVAAVAAGLVESVYDQVRGLNEDDSTDTESEV